MGKQNKKKYGIFAAIGFSVIMILLLTQNDQGPTIVKSKLLDGEYITINSQLKKALNEEDLIKSSPLIFQGKDALAKYCTFFEDNRFQDIVEFCTSTEIKNSQGKFLGNFHLVGPRNSPEIALTVAQTNPFFDELPEVKQIFNLAIENLVCDCWEQLKPGDIDSIDSWVDRQKDFHTSDTKPTSKSTLALAEKNLQMELTTNTEGYLWKLIISKN